MLNSNQMGTNINWEKKSDFEGSARVFIKMKTLSELVKNELSVIKTKPRENISDFIFITQATVN